MRYVQINTCPTGSTGSIMLKLHRELLGAGEESWAMWGRGRPAEAPGEFSYGTRAGVYLDALATRLDDRAGFHSRAATHRLIVKLDEVDPDVVHLHNLHGYHVNVEMLFGWLAAHRCRVRWTLHDCWAFTGHCAHFTYVGCERWREGCRDCPQKGTYPASAFADASARNWRDKRRVFSSVPPERMKLITPSCWLAGLVGQSFLSAYGVEVRHNEIDREVFKPTPSDFRERYGLEGKFVVLGVASPWTERKGLGDFVRLAGELDADRYAVVLVGLSKEQVSKLPEGVLGLGRTSSAAELVEIYTAADLFFNPTREDNYPTVNLEAEACGTPVLTYGTGGSPETLRRADSGVAEGFGEALGAIAAAAALSGGAHR